MKVHIPYMRKGPEYDALAEAIEKGAAAAKITDERGVVFLAGFLESVVDQVAMGKVVPLFSVAKVGASLEERNHHRKLYNRGYPYCVPRFVPGRAFRQQVKATAPNSRSAKNALDNFARKATRTSGKPGAYSRMVFTNMAMIQSSIAKQMGQED